MRLALKPPSRGQPCPLTYFHLQDGAQDQEAAARGTPVCLTIELDMLPLYVLCFEVD